MVVVEMIVIACRFLFDPVLVFSELRDHRDNSVLSIIHDYDNDNAPDVFSASKNLMAQRHHWPD